MVWIYLISYFIAFIAWFCILAKNMLKISQRFRNTGADQSEIEQRNSTLGGNAAYALLVLSFATGSLLGYVLCSLFGVPQ